MIQWLHQNGSHVRIGGKLQYWCHTGQDSVEVSTSQQQATTSQAPRASQRLRRSAPWRGPALQRGDGCGNPMWRPWQKPRGPAHATSLVQPLELFCMNWRRITPRFISKTAEPCATSSIPVPTIETLTSTHSIVYICDTYPCARSK